MKGMHLEGSRVAWASVPMETFHYEERIPARMAFPCLDVKGDSLRK